MATITKNPDGDVSLGNLRGEIVTVQPAVSDYVTGGYLLQGIGGFPLTAGDVGLTKILGMFPLAGQAGLTPVWNATTQKLQIFAPSVPDGVPLGLGPVSVAKSTTIGVTGSPTSLVTVAIANSLRVGQFVYLQSFTAGGALNGSIVQVVSATATGFTAYAPGAANITALTADTTGTYQVVQAGIGNILSAGTAATITNSAATAASPSVMTITCANTFQPGQFIVLQGLTTNTALNGVLAQIISSSATQFTANWYYTGSALVSAADTGTASLLVTTGGAPIATDSVFVTSNSASTASSAGTAGVVTITAKVNTVAGNIIVMQGMTNLAIQNGGIFVVNIGSLSVTTFASNHLATTVGSAADTTGTGTILTTGAPISGLVGASAEVQPGTDLSAYTFQLLVVGI